MVKIISLVIGIVIFVTALSIPSFLPIGMFWPSLMAFTLLLLTGYLLKLSEGYTNLGCFIGLLVYVILNVEDLGAMIFIIAFISLVPLVFGLLGFKLGITVRDKFT